MAISGAAHSVINFLERGLSSICRIRPGRPGLVEANAVFRPESVDETRYAERVKQLISDFVIFGIAGCLVASGTLVAQSRDELRRNYGEPVSETFMVRPGISVTATYATNGRVTELVVSPRTTDLIKSRGKTLSKDSVKAILDELVPSPVRGNYLIAGFVNLACLPENDCQGSSVSYEKLTIYYNSAAEGGVHYAVVQWKE